MFKRRIGLDPHEGGTASAAASGCPDIWELEDGNFAVIGIDKTTNLFPVLPPSAGCGIDERIVILPRRVLLTAKKFIPDK